jgi:hypothetical protein
MAATKGSGDRGGRVDGCGNDAAGFSRRFRCANSARVTLSIHVNPNQFRRSRWG